MVRMSDPSLHVNIWLERARSPVPSLGFAASSQHLLVLRFKEREPWVSVTFILSLTVLIHEFAEVRFASRPARQGGISQDAIPVDAGVRPRNEEPLPLPDENVAPWWLLSLPLAAFDGSYKIGFQRFFCLFDRSGARFAWQSRNEPVALVMSAKKPLFAKPVCCGEQQMAKSRLRVHDTELHIGKKLNVEPFPGPVLNDVDRQWALATRDRALERLKRRTHCEVMDQRLSEGERQ